MIWPWHHGLDVVFSYVLLHVVKFGEPRWDKWLAWGENIYHFKHSSKFWLRGYWWFSFKGPLKLLNKRLRPKLEYCNNSVIFLTDFGEIWYAAFLWTPISSGKISARSQRPKARRSQGQRPNFQKVSRSNFNHNLGHLQRFHINFCPKTPHCRRFGFRAQGAAVQLWTLRGCCFIH